MGLQVNRNKCHIVPLDKPFRFCKCKFYLTETGHVITTGETPEQAMELGKRVMAQIGVEIQYER